jgi:hypothetical protein
MRFVYRAAGILSLAGVAACATATGEVVHFQSKPNQQVMMREGSSIITSRNKNSIVTMRPASREASTQPVFIVGIQSVSRQPLDFRVRGVTATQLVDGKPERQLKVYSYDDLVAQERNAQIGRGLLVAVLSGVNSGLAGDDPNAAAAAEQRNAVMAAQVEAAGQQNLQALEELAIKDHTLMPGEQYAGKLVLEGPAYNAKSYVVTLMVGPDRHEIFVVHGR